MSDVDDDVIDEAALDGETATEKAQIALMVRNIIKKLPMRRRLVLIMHDLDGDSIEQIAQALEIPQNTAWNDLLCARKDFETAVRRLNKQDRDALGISGVWLAPAALDPAALLKWLDAVDPPGIDIDAMAVRVWHRIQDRLETLPEDGADMDSAVPPQMSAGLSGAGLGAGNVALGVGKLISGGAALFVLGAGAGVAGTLHAISSQTPAQPIATAAEDLSAVSNAMPSTPITTTVPLSSVASAASATSAAPPAATPAAGPGPAPVQSTAAGPGRGQTDADLAMIQRAIAALNAGNASEALSVLQRHAEKYPRSDGQQREALTILALAASGQHREASARAQRFRQAYPKSAFLPSIDRGLRGPPRPF